MHGLVLSVPQYIDQKVASKSGTTHQPICSLRTSPAARRISDAQIVRLRRLADAKMIARGEMSVCVGSYLQRSDAFWTCKCIFWCNFFLFLLNEQV
jgi:hypothetical protein